MSGEAEYYKRGVNYQSLTARQGWEQRENSVYTSHGVAFLLRKTAHPLFISMS